MRILDFAYRHGVESRNGYIAIPELDRVKPSVRQFIALMDLGIVLTRPTAFLYIDGFSLSPSESGLTQVNIDNYPPVVRSGITHIAHEWVYTFQGKEHLRHVNTISGTCAAGIQAIYEADRLLREGVVQEVIIIGGERITDFTMQLFSQLRIPVTCGDGFVYMRVARGDDIKDIRWEYQYDRNPFMFSREVLDTLTPGYPVDYVKLHDSGTEANTTAEAGLRALASPVSYKARIGHTQGPSALIETCMLLKDPHIQGKILVTANGFGGYYGAFTLIKNVHNT